MEQNTGKKVFRVVFFVFLAIVIWILIDMSKQTTAPWNKRKQIERVIEK